MVTYNDLTEDTSCLLIGGPYNGLWWIAPNNVAEVANGEYKARMLSDGIYTYRVFVHKSILDNRLLGRILGGYKPNEGPPAEPYSVRTSSGSGDSTRSNVGPCTEVAYPD